MHSAVSAGECQEMGGWGRQPADPQWGDTRSSGRVGVGCGQREQRAEARISWCGLCSIRGRRKGPMDEADAERCPARVTESLPLPSHGRKPSPVIPAPGLLVACCPCFLSPLGTCGSRG